MLSRKPSSRARARCSASAGSCASTTRWPTSWRSRLRASGTTTPGARRATFAPTASSAWSVGRRKPGRAGREAGELLGGDAGVLRARDPVDEAHREVEARRVADEPGELAGRRCARRRSGPARSPPASARRGSTASSTSAATSPGTAGSATGVRRPCGTSSGAEVGACCVVMRWPPHQTGGGCAAPTLAGCVGPVGVSRSTVLGNLPCGTGGRPRSGPLTCAHAAHAGARRRGRVSDVPWLAVEPGA